MLTRTRFLKMAAFIGAAYGIGIRPCSEIVETEERPMATFWSWGIGEDHAVGVRYYKSDNPDGRFTVGHSITYTPVPVEELLKMT